MHTLTTFPFSGVYEVPLDIGRGAEQILQGCLERNISDRWNIAMVDDVAWGVGWGAEGDDATHTNPEELELQYKQPHSLRPAGLITINWEQEGRCPSSTPSPLSSPIFSMERGRRPKKFSSRSPSPSAPSTPQDDARVPLTGVLENLDEFHLDPSTRESSSVRSSLDSDQKLDAMPMQRTVGFEDGIADWTARTQDMETIIRDDDTEVDAIVESETLVTAVTITSDRQHSQRSGSVPRPSLRWAKTNNNYLYPEHRLTPADPFLNALSRSRSAECRM